MVASEHVASGCVLVMCIAFVIAQIWVAKGSSAPEKVPDTGSVVGWVGVACAVACFGSYAIPIKAEKIQGVHPVVFQQFMGLGVVCCSALVLVETEFVFSWWGILGAALWSTASIFAYNAIRSVGMATGMAIWGGLTVLVSFIWGAVAFGQHVNDVLGAIAALLVLISGIAFAASAQTSLPVYIAAKLGCASRNGSPGVDSPDVYAAVAPDKGVPPAELPPPLVVPPATTTGAPTMAGGSDVAVVVPTVEEGASKDGIVGDNVGPSLVVRGIFWAVMVGLVNGSMMAPFEMYSRDDEIKRRVGDAMSRAYLISFGIGVAAFNPILLALAHLLARLRGDPPPALHFKVTLTPGFLCGVFWSAGNFGSIYATQYLGSTLGFPLTQCAIAAVGFWGILYFREIVGKPAITQFAVSVLLICAGAMWLVNSAG